MTLPPIGNALMESRFKIRMSRVFRSSFASCRSKNLSSDVIGQPVFVAQEDFEPYSPPKVEIIPSIPIGRPKLVKLQEEGPEIVGKDPLFRRKVSDRGLYFVSGGKEGRTCPPASPISPMNALFKLHDKEMKDRKKTAAKKTKKQVAVHHHSKNGWFSSEEDETEDETETFFSSRSLSSDSSASLARRRNQRSSRRRRAKKKIVPEMGLYQGMVEESVAIVKRSTDPYNDFRTSMVEMIIEKQIFSAKDLEKLLQCFLSLNSPHHHRIIVEVFTEVWEALFSLT